MKSRQPLLSLRNIVAGNMVLHLLVIFFSLQAFTGCAQKAITGEKAIVNESRNGEMVAFLKSNFEQAELVVVMDVDSIEISRKIKADEGSIGYLVIKQSGTVRKTYKGNVLPGSRVTFVDWIEYSNSWEKNRKGSLLVFLKKDPETGAYRTIGEGGVLRYDSDIRGKMECLLKQ